MARQHRLRNYRIIRVMLWAFPYLLWQAFGHWSGFFVGVIVAVVLTAMLTSLIHTSEENANFATRQQAFQATEPQPQYQEAEVYQHGYRAETEPYRAEPCLYLTGKLQPQYEEMQVFYPQEIMPPME